MSSPPRTEGSVASAGMSGSALVLAATLLFAFKGVIARVVLATGLSVVGVVSLRVLLATPLYVLVAVFLLRKSRRDREAATPEPAQEPAQEPARTSPTSPRAALEAMVVGAFFLGAAGCDFTAIERIGAGPSRVILFSFPGVVMVIESLRSRSLPRAVEVVTFAVAWSGLALVAAPEGLGALQGRDLSGALYAMAGAVSYAIFLTASQGSMKRLGSVRFTALANVGTLLALLVALPFVASPDDFRITPKGLGWIVVMVTGCTVLPFFLLSRGIERAGAGPASLLTLVGPPVTVVAAYFFLGETLRPLQAAGALLVLTSIASLKLRDARKARLAQAREDLLPPMSAGRAAT